MSTPENQRRNLVELVTKHGVLSVEGLAKRGSVLYQRFGETGFIKKVGSALE